MSFIKRVLKNRRRIDLPVLVQEMRIRQRGIRPFVLMFIYVAVLSVVTLLVAELSRATPTFGSPQGRHASDLARVGQELFLALSLAQLVMISLIVPAYGSAAVTTEQERGTFDLLALTRLPSWRIITQKLVAATAEVLMLTITSLPVLGIVFMLGGVSPLEVAIVFAIMLITAIFLGALGMLCSCCFAKTRSATLAAYLSVIAFLAGAPLAAEWIRTISGAGLHGAMEACPFMVVGTFLLVGGIGAFVGQGFLALIMKRVELWRTRAFRMAVFGASYILLMLMLSVPGLTVYMTGLFYGAHRDISLPMFVNPFVAIVVFLEEGGASSYWWNGLAAQVVTATVVFAVLCTFIFQYVSTIKFRALRRRA